MSRILDDVISVDIECECGKKFPKTVGWIRRHRQFDCTACGTTINIEADEFFDALKGAERAASDLQRTIDKINKVLG